MYVKIISDKCSVRNFWPCSDIEQFQESIKLL